MDEEERMRERNRIHAKKHTRVRKIEEEYSGDQKGKKKMLLRTPLKNNQKRAE